MDKIFRIEKDRRDILKPLFDGMQDTSVWSCLQGRNFARMWADDEQSPTCAVAMVGGVRPGSGGFAFISGRADSEASVELVRCWKNDVTGGHIIVPHGDGWRETIIRAFGSDSGWHKRYATSKTEADFDRARLRAWAENLPEGYTMRRIDRELFEVCMNGGWSLDNVANFADFDEFVRDGHQMGFAVMFAGEPVSIASPYSAYDKGVEIEIDTREDHRRKGLARACASRLILECLDSGLYPSWDAANTMSIALAGQLGYKFTKEYDACFFQC